MKLKITIDQKTYEVDVEAVEPETPAPPPSGYAVHSVPVRVPGAPAVPVPVPTDTAPVNEGKVCRSPVSGVVVRIVAQSGQSIQTGDVLLVLEAMKMETNITAPFAGKIAAVKAKTGEGVQTGQVVVEFE